MVGFEDEAFNKASAGHLGNFREMVRDLILFLGKDALTMALARRLGRLVFYKFNTWAKIGDIEQQRS